MHKDIPINSKSFAFEFDIDASPTNLVLGISHIVVKVRLFLYFSFPYFTPRDVNRKLLRANLSLKDRIFHLPSYNIIKPRINIFTQIVEDELFLMWVIKNQLDFNMPYFILNYLVEC